MALWINRVKLENSTKALSLDPNSGGTHYAAEASTLGLPPGSFPQMITVQMPPHGMEPELPQDFDLVKIEYDRFGDALGADYASPMGSTFLTIFND